MKEVRGDSMAGLLAPGQSIAVDENYFACHAPARGDLVEIDLAPGVNPLVKRIGVVPGDRFRLAPARKAGGFVLEVNGAALRAPGGAPYLFDGKRREMIALYESSFGGVMPADTYFVFGSIPDGSRDSGQFGPVRRERLVGKVVRRRGR